MDLWVEDLYNRDVSCFVTEYLKMKKASKFDEKYTVPRNTVAFYNSY